MSLDNATVIVVVNRNSYYVGQCHAPENLLSEKYVYPWLKEQKDVSLSYAFSFSVAQELEKNNPTEHGILIINKFRDTSLDWLKEEYENEQYQTNYKAGLLSVRGS